MTDNTVFQILLSAKVVDYLARQYVLHHSVDGKIPPLCRLVRTYMGIYEYVKVAVPPASVGFGSGHRNIKRIASQPEDAKALADLQPLTETVKDILKCVGCDTVYFDVDILTLMSFDKVADVSANEIGTAAARINTLCDFSRHFHIRNMHTSPSFQFFYLL